MRNYQLADKAGCTKNWRSEDYNGYREVYHYSTLMLKFDISTREVIYTSTGHGSVSDQQTMNQLFARLEMPLYFSRAGGAEIRELDAPQYRYGVSPGTPRLTKRGTSYVREMV